MGNAHALQHPLGTDTQSQCLFSSRRTRGRAVGGAGAAHGHTHAACDSSSVDRVYTASVTPTSPTRGRSRHIYVVKPARRSKTPVARGPHASCARDVNRVWVSNIGGITPSQP